MIKTGDLIGRSIRLEPLASNHREALRAACEADQDIWEIYPVCLIGDHFDRWWESVEGWASADVRRPYAVVAMPGMANNTVIGMTSFYRWPGTPSDSISIGSTYYVPHWRGTTVNPEAKLLLMDQAFAANTQCVTFHVDQRNTRSQSAMRKLGATQTQIIEKHMTTWNGHVRSTVCFEITAMDWPVVRSRLVNRLELTSQ